MPSANADPLDQHVTDDAMVLSRSYAEDLNRRLNHYAEQTGYGIYIVLLRDQADVSYFMRRLFVWEKLDKVSPDGAVALVIAYRNREARIATSENLNRKFAQPDTITYVEKQLAWVQNRQFWRDNFTIEEAVENSVGKIIETIDPWFYLLEPSSERGVYFHSILAEMILFPLAPFSALMSGIFLMAFSRVGDFGVLARSMIAGVSASLLAVAEACLLRQPGGILPAVLYYSMIAAFVVAALVGALKPFWFNDKFTGKKSDAWWSGPVHFYRG
ncbi:MAG TPA: TPM domain-containing protein [Candidatus Binatia bacterium]|jgi:uncharacterized membrane protein YgcG